MRHWHRRLDMLADKDKDTEGENAEQGEILCRVVYQWYGLAWNIVFRDACLLAVLSCYNTFFLCVCRRRVFLLICVSVRQAGDGDQDDVGKDDEEGGDDGGDGKFEYVTSNERGSSQVSVA